VRPPLLEGTLNSTKGRQDADQVRDEEQPREGAVVPPPPAMDSGQLCTAESSSYGTTAIGPAHPTASTSTTGPARGVHFHESQPLSCREVSRCCKKPSLPPPQALPPAQAQPAAPHTIVAPGCSIRVALALTRSGIYSDPLARRTGEDVTSRSPLAVQERAQQTGAQCRPVRRRVKGCAGRRNRFRESGIWMWDVYRLGWSKESVSRLTSAWEWRDAFWGVWISSDE